MKPRTYLERERNITLISRHQHLFHFVTHGGTESKFAEAPLKFKAAMIVGVKRASEYKGIAMLMYKAV